MKLFNVFATLLFSLAITTRVAGQNCVVTPPVCVPSNGYAFQYSQDADFGLFFNVGTDSYEFTDDTGNAVFGINAFTGNTTINGKLSVGEGSVGVSAFTVFDGNSDFGNLSGYGRFEADGDLLFNGTADYLVANNSYAFRYKLNENYGLYFNGTGVAYEFRTADSSAVFSIGANSGELKTIGSIAVGIDSPGIRLQVFSNIPGSGLPAARFYQNNCGIPCGQANGMALQLVNRNTIAPQFGARLSFADPANVANGDDGAAVIKLVDRGNPDGSGGLAITTRDASGVMDERIRIDKSGNLGIGTITPEEKLDVQGTIRIRDLKVQGIRPVYTDGDGRLTTSKKISKIDPTDIFIPNGICPGITRTILASGYPSMVSSSTIQVHLYIRHSAVGQLDAFLIAPTGDTLRLLSGDGGTADHINTTFSDDGILLSAGSPPYTGIFKPNGTIDPPGNDICGVTSNISTFSQIGGGSINPNGPWTLRLVDNVIDVIGAIDTGSIKEWGISFGEPAAIGVDNFHAKWADGTLAEISQVYDDGNHVGIGTTSFTFGEKLAVSNGNTQIGIYPGYFDTIPNVSWTTLNMAGNRGLRINDELSVAGDTEFNGDVGIGTANPTEKLHVMGTARMSDLSGTGVRPVFVESDGKLVTRETTTSSNSTLQIIPISSCPGVTSSINFTGYPSLVSSSSVQISLNISHPDINELDVLLIAPTGDVIHLMLAEGGFCPPGLSDIQTTFSDFGMPLSSGCPPYTGVFKPNGYVDPLGSMNLFCGIGGSIVTFSEIGAGNLDPNGVWTLRVMNRTGDDAGVLISWSVTIGGGGIDNFHPKWVDGTLSRSSLIYDDGINVGIGTITPLGLLELSLDEGRKPSTGTWTITSDKRLKNINGVYEKGLDDILKLDPVRYHYKNTGERRFDEQVLAKENVGFIAQEVQKAFPESVGTDEDGYLNFNMHAILVAQVNAIKELNQKVEAVPSSPVQLDRIKQLESENERLLAIVKELTNRMDAMENGMTQFDITLDKCCANHHGNAELNKATLGQNIPNPFGQSTIIPYYIPEGSGGASIWVSDQEGKLLQEYRIDRRGVGHVEFSANQLSTGTYLYSLIIDGQVVDTKKLVLTSN